MPKRKPRRSRPTVPQPDLRQVGGRVAEIVVTEAIRGVAVCLNTARRNQLESSVNSWARRAGFSAPSAEEVPAGKYGTGPTLVIAVDFPDLASADAAWAQINGFDPTWILDGSMIQQFTAREDGETVNETIVHHKYEWRNGQRIQVV